MPLFPCQAPILVSACLVGLRCRYDGQCKPSPACMAALAGRTWLPVCPEQQGGLPTPRPPAELSGGDGHAVLAGRARVLRRDGRGDVTEEFIRGARQVLIVARAQAVELALLKASSPSCGLWPRPGVLAALLLAHGIETRQF